MISKPWVLINAVRVHMESAAKGSWSIGREPDKSAVGKGYPRCATARLITAVLSCAGYARQETIKPGRVSRLPDRGVGHIGRNCPNNTPAGNYHRSSSSQTSAPNHRALCRKHCESRPGASFSPASVRASESATLTMSTLRSTPLDTYPIFITGRSGRLNPTASIILIVTTNGKR